MPKKITLPVGSRPPAEARVLSTTETLLNDFKAILGAELARYRAMVNRGGQLDLKQARIVQGYAETLIKLSREERELIRNESFNDLTDKELLEMIKEISKDGQKLAMHTPKESA